ncbi:GntR family transcriptional regulator [Paracoccus pantotrophus]|nr:GntR family transcriptional regulator [Paracoccus pantotrophus]
MTRRLEEAIMGGELAPGARISEQALAVSLGVSRGPLREAIRRLEGRRLVERKQNVGVRVAELSPGALSDLMVVREALEGMACRLAAERMSDADLEELSKLLLDHADQEDLRDGKAYVQQSYDNDFHFRIINASGNAKLIDSLVNDLYDLLRLYRRRSSKASGRAKKAWQEHKAILDALRTRDGNKAETAMRAHIANARQSLEQGYS